MLKEVDLVGMVRGIILTHSPTHSTTHSLTHVGTKLTYMGKDVSVFVLSLLFSIIVNYFGINNSVVVDMVINIAVIAPLSILIGVFLVYLYTCPCTESLSFQRNYSNLQGTHSHT